MWEPFFRFVRIARRPLERFLRIEAASGVFLLVSAAVALGWASSPWADSYVALWRTPIGGDHTLSWLINDALMVVFFFVVGLEIRREIHHGELSELRRATLPAAAALGGMLVPAAIYVLFAHAGATRQGWGVPMATDIAFALGVLALLGRRVPPALRVLLLALAVIDDLGAIVVIAIFYSAGIVWSGLAIALGGVVLVLVMQRVGVRAKVAYLVPGIITWAGVYAAGVHPTIAGVILGLLTPVREARREAVSPAESLIAMLHPWVAFGIMPIFAFANAGVSLGGWRFDATSLDVVLGSALGLLVGKPVGVLLACLLALKLRLSTLPRGLSVRHLVVLGVVAGVGFTMSLFIAQLAFSSPALLGAAKLGVLVASLAAGVLALLLGRVLLRAETIEAAAKSADEAERSTEL